MRKLLPEIILKYNNLKKRWVVEVEDKIRPFKKLDGAITFIIDYVEGEWEEVALR